MAAYGFTKIRKLRKIVQFFTKFRVHCAHEYTLANLGFARWVEPDSPALAERAVEILGGHPFYLQILGESLVSEPDAPDVRVREPVQHDLALGHAEQTRHHGRVIGIEGAADDAPSPIEEAPPTLINVERGELDADGEWMHGVWVQVDSERRCEREGGAEHGQGLRGLGRVRAKVAEASGGAIGYLHLPDTYVGSAIEFPKQFYAQSRKEGLIVDGRFNGGGLDPDIFLQRLARRPLSHWTRRYSRDQTTPVYANRAHMVCLTNRQAGSGGDELPFEFRAKRMGPIIGVHSLSTDASIKVYQGRSTYSEWKFIFQEEEGSGGQGGQPQPTNQDPWGSPPTPISPSTRSPASSSSSSRSIASSARSRWPRDWNNCARWKMACGSEWLSPRSAPSVSTP